MCFPSSSSFLGVCLHLLLFLLSFFYFFALPFFLLFFLLLLNYDVSTSFVLFVWNTLRLVLFICYRPFAVSFSLTCAHRRDAHVLTNWIIPTVITTINTSVAVMIITTTMLVCLAFPAITFLLEFLTTPSATSPVGSSFLEFHAWLSFHCFIIAKNVRIMKASASKIHRTVSAILYVTPIFVSLPLDFMSCCCS